MKIPFTVDQFMGVFKNYNTAVFPLQIALYLFALGAIYSSFNTNSRSDKIISSILSFLWLWMGVVYHLIFFTVINKAAYLFATLFVLQSGLFLWKGAFRNQLSFRFRKDIYGITGIALLAFALAIYPLISYELGHIYPYSPTFLDCLALQRFSHSVYSYGLTKNFQLPCLLFLLSGQSSGFLQHFLLG